MTAVAMAAFAANSVLNRMAIRLEGAQPLEFAAVRLLSGALVLLVLCRGRIGPVLTRRRLVGAAGLLAYMLGFSVSYRALDAGTGALILFGGVQVTMFGWAAATERVPTQRYVGTAIAFAGLAWLVWPGAGARIDPMAALAMGVAAVGWGAYSLLGRQEAEPLRATAAGFLIATGPALLVAAATHVAGAGMGFRAAALAMISGGVTSGLGYALWYRLLPQLGATRAAVSQLTVPVLALGLGAAVLGERPAIAALGATLVVLGGVAVSVIPIRWLRWPRL